MYNPQKPYFIKTKDFAKKLILPTFITVLFVCVTGIFLFSANRIGFENISDRACAEEFILSDDNSVFQSLVEQRISALISDFENKEAVMNDMLYALVPERLSFYKADEYTANHPVYNVFSDNNHFFTVSLSKEKGILSLFGKWVVSDVSVSNDCEMGNEFYIEVPCGATVKVNETLLDDSYLYSEKSDYFALIEFEQGLSHKYTSDIYCIGTIFNPSSLKITAFLNGAELTCTEESSSSVKFRYPLEYTSVYNFTVPLGADVKVNGIALSNDYIINGEAEYPFLSRFEKNTKNSQKAVTYQISGLFNKPEILVFYNGIALETYGNRGSYKIPDEMTHSFKILVPQNSKVKINGVVLEASEITNSKVDFPLLSEISDYIKNREYMTEYTIHGLLSPPDISAENSQGLNLLLNERLSSENVYFFISPNLSISKKDQDFLEDFSKKYITYVYEGAKNIAENYYSVADMTVGKSPAFNQIRKLYKDLQSTETKTDINFGNIVFGEYTKYSENSFSCIMNLTFSYNSEGKTLTESISFEVLYIYYGNSQKIIDFNLY